MQHTKNLLMLIAFVILSGCAYSEIDQNMYNAEQVRVGMTKEQVLSIMGEPLNEAFCSPDVWYYYVKVRWNDGLYTEDESIPLMFENGVLVGWGHEYKARKRLVKPLEKSADKVNKETGDSLQREPSTEIKDSKKTISL